MVGKFCVKIEKGRAFAPNTKCLKKNALDLKPYQITKCQSVFGTLQTNLDIYTIMIFKNGLRIPTANIQKWFPNDCKLRNMSYGGNRMVFSSEKFLSFFLQSTRPSDQNFSP